MKTILLSYCENCGLWNGVAASCKKCGETCPKKAVPARRANLYFVDGVGVPLVGVTTVMRVIAKPALSVWLQKQTAMAVFEDPTISMEEALAAPNKIRDAAGSKGSSIHQVIEAAANGMEIVLDNYSDPWKKHVEAYLAFRSEIPHQILVAEQVVFSKQHHFAGTLDSLIKIGDSVYLVDFKTNKQIYPLDHCIQLSGYHLALQEMGQKVDKCAVVHLKSDGSYAFVEIKPQPEVFLAALKLYQHFNAA